MITEPTDRVAKLSCCGMFIAKTVPLKYVAARDPLIDPATAKFPATVTLPPVTDA